MSEHSHDPLADETLRLVSTVQDWARRSFPADAEHAASECQWCPLCQFVAVLRGDRPEVTARVAEAGTALVGAFRALLDAAVEGASTSASNSTSSSAPDSTSNAVPNDATDAAPNRAPSSARHAPRPRVQRINLSDES